ncbi:MAG: hypothetical protein BJ554DRAFT_6318, partial [Olpidium bornovanus]
PPTPQTPPQPLGEIHAKRTEATHGVQATKPKLAAVRALKTEGALLVVPAGAPELYLRGGGFRPAPLTDRDRLHSDIGKQLQESVRATGTNSRDVPKAESGPRYVCDAEKGGSRVRNSTKKRTDRVSMLSNGRPRDETAAGVVAGGGFAPPGEQRTRRVPVSFVLWRRRVSAVRNFPHELGGLPEILDGDRVQILGHPEAHALGSGGKGRIGARRSRRRAENKNGENPEGDSERANVLLRSLAGVGGGLQDSLLARRDRGFSSFSGAR